MQVDSIMQLWNKRSANHSFLPNSVRFKIGRKDMGAKQRWKTQTLFQIFFCFDF